MSQNSERINYTVHVYIHVHCICVYVYNSLTSKPGFEAMCAVNTLVKVETTNLLQRKFSLFN